MTSQFMKQQIQTEKQMFRSRKGRKSSSPRQHRGSMDSLAPLETGRSAFRGGWCVDPTTLLVYDKGSCLSPSRHNSDK